MSDPTQALEDFLKKHNVTDPQTLTEHQHNWWGTQKCRRCNPLGLEKRSALHLAVCPDCDGSGWTEWAALATEPWSEIIPNLWIGGHDYNDASNGRSVTADAYPKDTFNVVVSMYHRGGDFLPSEGTEHHEVLFSDSRLSPKVLERASRIGQIVAERVREGRHVLVRCQAGLNRSSLVAGLAMIELGFKGEDAVQLIRARRSPWALCNDSYADHLINQK